MEYLPVDRKLADNAVLVFADDVGSPDINKSNSGRRAYAVTFQFPPKVTSDSKSGDWDETANNFAFSEPFGVFKGSKPRTINLKWSYIVDSSGKANESTWTTKRIATITQALRGYFGRMDISFGDTITFNPTIVYFGLYRHQRAIKRFRIDSIDISYSENLIIPREVDDRDYSFVVDKKEKVTQSTQSYELFDEAFPLKTDISLTLKPFPRGALDFGSIQTALEEENVMSREWF